MTDRKKPPKAGIARNSGDVINSSQERSADEKAKSPKELSGTLADKPYAGRKEKTLSGKHSGAGQRVYGVRRRAGKPQDAERVSEDSEEYSSTTRFIESSLGIKSYAELAPHLAKGVERVMASLIDLSPADLCRHFGDVVSNNAFHPHCSSPPVRLIL